MAVAALVAAGVHAAQHARREPAKRIFAAAALLALAYYVWPSPSEGPVAHVLLLVRPLLRGASNNLVSASILITLALSPSMLVAFGWFHARRAQGNPASLAALLALYGPPALSWPLVTRALAGRPGDFSTLAVASGEILASIAFLVWLGQAAGFLAVHPDTTPLIASRAWSSPKRAITVGALVLSTLAPWAPAREHAGAWHPGPPNASAEALFARDVPSWNDARGPSATDAGARLVAHAREVDRELGRSLDRLVQAAPRREVGLEAWEDWFPT